MEPNPIGALAALWWIIPLGILGAIFIQLATPPDDHK
jgi:hypothetical protein